ncbi:MAG TPA: EamA family transporter [Burkholderiales bacterium]|nr:EamA family transporter [Burkholderiales bacterium]
MSRSPVPRWVGIAILLAIATTFGSNHVAARVAFDHGASVATAVAFRAAGTAVALAAALLVLRLPLRMPAASLARTAAVGAILAVQSYCLYSAVARIPAALALLAFNTYPLLFALMSAAAGMERLSRRALFAMPAALFGLALALDVVGGADKLASRWGEIGAGATFAAAASLCFATVLFVSARFLHGVDGRVRSGVINAVVAVLVLAVGAPAGLLALPADTAGWTGLLLLTLFYGSAITALFVLQPRLRSAADIATLNFEPIAVLLLGWAILGQSLEPRQIAGALVVIAAIVALATAKR